MKKILCLLIVGVMIFGLCACSVKENKDSTNPNAPEPSIEGTESIQGATENRDNDVMKVGDVVFEDETLKLTLKGFNFQGDDAEDVYFNLTFEAENKLNRPIDVDLNSASVNSFTIYASTDDEIEGGKKTELNMLFEVTAQTNKAIVCEEDISEIKFELSFNDDDHSIDVVQDICLYPNGDREYDFIGYEMKNGDAIMVDNDMFTIIYKGVNVDNDKVVYVDYYMRSKDGKSYNLQVEGMVGEAKVSYGSMAPNYITVKADKEIHEDLSIWTTEQLVNESETAAIRFVVLGSDFMEVETTEWFQFTLVKEASE